MELLELLKEVTEIVEGVSYANDGSIEGFGIGDWKDEFIIATESLGYQFTDKQITLIARFLAMVTHPNNIK